MTHAMQITEGSPVFLGEKQVGKVDRVVIDPQTRHVSHLVVHKGLFFTHDKVVPMERVAHSDATGVHLQSEVDIKDLPEFEEVAYIPLDADTAKAWDVGQGDPLLYSHPLGGAGASGSANLTQKTVERNTPAGAIALRKGASVRSADGTEVGHVEVILTDTAGDATHIVIGDGEVEKKAVPMAWAAEMDDESITLTVSPATLERLPAYSA